MGRAWFVLAVVLAGCGGTTTGGDAGADAGGGDAPRADGGACERVTGAGAITYDEPATGQRRSEGPSLLCRAEGADVVVCNDVVGAGQPGEFVLRLRFPGGWRAPADGEVRRSPGDFTVESVTPWGGVADPGPWAGEFILRGDRGPGADAGVAPSLGGYGCGARYRLGITLAPMLF
jgi:hypothetical protein